MKKTLFILLMMPIMAFCQGPDKLVHDTHSYVDDYAGIYTEPQKAELSAIIKPFWDTVQISLVTVKSLDGYDISDYTVKLFNRWGIGSKSNNGLMLLIAPTEHKAWATTGRAIQGDLTDLQCAKIQRDVMTPEFKKGNYFLGTKKCLQAYIQKLSPSAKQYHAQQQAKAPDGGQILYGWLILCGSILAIIVIVVLIVRRQNRKSDRLYAEELERQEAIRKQAVSDYLNDNPGTSSAIKMGAAGLIGGIIGANIGSITTKDKDTYKKRDDDDSGSSSFYSSSSSSSSDDNDSFGSSSSDDSDSSSGSDFGGGSSDGGGGGSDW